VVEGFNYYFYEKTGTSSLKRRDDPEKKIAILLAPRGSLDEKVSFKRNLAGEHQGVPGGKNYSKT